MPHLITESGRALTAHHALLLLKVIDIESVTDQPLPDLQEDDHQLLHEMAADFKDVSRKNVSRRRAEANLHNPTVYKDRAHEVFHTGVRSQPEEHRARQ